MKGKVKGNKNNDMEKQRERNDDDTKGWGRQ